MDIPSGTIIASRYKIVRELGRGGMGAVYLVEHVNTGDHAALKVMLGTGHVDMESLERFKREARAPGKIKSEHVVKVLDADNAPELGGAMFLVMELLQGTDLQKLVRQRGRLGPDEVVDWLQQASIALDKSHALGIVHRDLKPENIYLHKREDGSICVKILDFGISKILPQASASAMPMTQLGSVMGTPLFMSPEQARGAVQMIGPQTDVWAIGLIAVHLLTGEHYWGNPKSLTELMTSIIRCDLYPPSSRWAFLPPLFDTWLYRSCAREPHQRFSTVGEQVAALAQALGVGGPRSIGATVTDPLGATAAAPSTQPRPAAAMTPISPQMGTPAPMSPIPISPQMGTPAPMSPPVYAPAPYGSTTAAGAVSRPYAPSVPEPSRGPSAGFAVAIGGGVFLLVTVVGVVIVLTRPPHKDPVVQTATTNAAVTTAPTPTPQETFPDLQHTPTIPTFVPPPPTHTAPKPSASAKPSATAPAPTTTKTQKEICIDKCTKECASDPDPMGCAKACQVDCMTSKL